MLIGAGVLGALTLVAWTRPTGLVIVLVVFDTLVVMGGLRLVAEVGRRADVATDGQPDELNDEPTIDVRELEPESTETDNEAEAEITTSGS